MTRIGFYRLLTFTFAAIVSTNPLFAQSGTLSNPSVPSTTLVPVPSTSSFGVQSRTPVAPTPFPSQAPSYQTAPPSVPRISAPPAPLQQPALSAAPLDPYSTRGTPSAFPGLFSRPTANSQPGIFGGAFGGSMPPAGAVAFPTTPQPFGTQQPYPQQFGTQTAPPPLGTTYGGAPYGQGTYPQGIYPNNSPSVLLPGGVNLPRMPQWNLPQLGLPSAGSWFGWNQQGTLFNNANGYRILQGPRFRHTWLYGDLGSATGDIQTNSDLEIHSSEVSVAFAYPNFFGSAQPLYIVPSFGLHLFNGGGSNHTNSFLDGKYYDAFVELGWQSDPNLIFGFELGARVGLFTNFNEINSDSLRGMGLALAKLRLTPTTTLKFGAIYADRIEVGILPAGGLLWQPTPNQRYDIFFPTPKASRYLTTVGLQDVWGYFAGEFGGGSWTFSPEEIGTTGQAQFDYRDLRVTIGLEWGLNHLMASGRRTGFIEAGYVFDREVIIRAPAQGGLLKSGGALDDTFMFRAGIGY